MIDLMTVHNHCEACGGCDNCPYLRLCSTIVDAADELQRLALALKMVPMEDIDKGIARRANLALKELFQTMRGNDYE